MRITMIITMLAGLLLASMTAVFAAKAATGNTGTLTAKGSGIIQALVLKGTVTIVGGGTLMVSKDATVTITGEQGTKEEVTPPARDQAAEAKKPNAAGNPRAMIKYTGFKGTVVITGQRLMVAVHGKDLTFTAKGIGKVLPIGEGSYSVVKDGQDAKQEGQWIAKPTKDNPEAQRPKLREHGIDFGVMPTREKGAGNEAPAQ